MKNIWLGLTSYSVGLEFQSAANSCLLGLEHEPAITLGKRLKEESQIQKTGNYFLERRQIGNTEFDVYQTDRGGQVTMHTPGQLVIYPVFDLKQLGWSIRDFVCAIEKTTIETLRYFKIDAFQKENQTGIFTEHGKIGFIGVRVANRITRHGLSLNVSNDLALFKHIISCGVEDQRMDSFKRQGSGATPADVFEIWSNNWWSLQDSNL